MSATGRVAAAAVVTATTLIGTAGCSSHHSSSTATTTTTTLAAVAPTAAPAGPNGARDLAAQAGCTKFDPLPTSGTLARLGAASAGTCTLGSDSVLFATTTTPSDIPRALSAAAELGLAAGVTVYAAVGPNWVAAGSSDPSRSLAAKIVSKLGGTVEKAVAPSPGGGSS